MKRTVLILLCLALCAFAVSAPGETVRGSVNSKGEITFMGVTADASTTLIDFGETEIKDLQALASFLEQLPAVTQVNMFANRMRKADCDSLAARFPEIRWGWTMVIAARNHQHLVRTDMQAWSTLHNNKSSLHSSEDFSVLKYCWDLKALDIGHNNVDDLSFLYDLPNLRVLIIAANKVTDITPIASLTKLEYLEMFKNRVTDLTPLAGLTHLMDLNLCNNKVQSLAPLEGMTWLKRLWIYRCTGKDIEKFTANGLKAKLPDTQIDYTHSGTNGSWRKFNAKQVHPHYAVIMKLFGENHLKPGDGSYYPFEDSWPEE